MQKYLYFWENFRIFAAESKNTVLTRNNQIKGIYACNITEHQSED